MGRLEHLLTFCTRGFGPHVARAIHLSIALVGVMAWSSWWAQVDVLLSAEGLSPAEAWVEQARVVGVSMWEMPTLVRVTGAGPTTLHLICAAGVVTCLLALGGVLARAALGVNAVLYLSFITVCGPFAAFQWDSLMVECFALGALLPREGGRLGPLALRLLFVRLYFGSGIAKLHSPAGDWLDGSAMAFYYETTPLPTPLSWWMHQLPPAWHRIESWATLAVEIALPFGAFGGRRVRHVTAAGFTGFQLVNLLTGNFGFFVYLSLALHVALLDDRTVARFVDGWPQLRWYAGRMPRLAGLRNAALSLYLALSLLEQSVALFDVPSGETVTSLRMAYLPLRLVNTYALFASITRTRVEPIVEIDDGTGFAPYPLRYKPGPADRPLPWVAPHQPRVDFRLWFYGLRSHGPPPGYVRRLLQLACEKPTAVKPLFPTDLPSAPRAVRLRFERYRFNDPETRDRTGAFWNVEATRVGATLSCRRPH